MNRYGLMAQKHWARWLPTRYATIEDPGSFFSSLGKQVADRIDSLALQLAGDDQPGEGSGRTSNDPWPTWPNATSPSSPPWSRPGSNGCSTGPASSKASSPAPASTCDPSVTPTIEDL
jgi:hypothetical protein